LNRLGDFLGQWVNPAVRQVRYSDYAILGQVPAAVNHVGTAPLLCAIIEAMYAADMGKHMKDDYIKWLNPIDVKVDLRGSSRSCAGRACSTHQPMNFWIKLSNRNPFYLFTHLSIYLSTYLSKYYLSV